MIEPKYKRAYTEVLEVISHFSPQEIANIPKEKIRFYEKNKDKDYEFKININEKVENYGLSREANAILVSIFLDYFIDDEYRRNGFIEMLKENQKRRSKNSEKI